MTSDVVLEEETEPVDEEGASRDGTGLSQPQRRRNWVDGVTGSDVALKVKKGFVMEAKCRNNDFVTLKKAVGLVSRQEELVAIRVYVHSVTSGDLLPVLECGVVRESKLAQAQEAKEARKDHCEEEEVVMRG